MNNLPLQNFHPGWPSFITDELKNEYVRIRDGNQVSVEPPIGNSCLYALIKPYVKVVSKARQYVPAFPWQEQVFMNGGVWTDNEVFLANGQPGLDELPRGYDYEKTA